MVPLKWTIILFHYNLTLRFMNELFKSISLEIVFDIFVSLVIEFQCPTF